MVFLCSLGCYNLFTQNILRIGLKASAESKLASKVKAAAENTRNQMLFRSYYCCFNFSVFTVSFGQLEQAGR
jgi:hypothetical protein